MLYRALLGVFLLCILSTTVHADTVVFSNETCGYNSNGIFEQTLGDQLLTWYHSATTESNPFDRVRMRMRADGLESPYATLRIYEVASASTGIPSATQIAVSSPTEINISVFEDVTFTLNHEVVFYSGHKYLFEVRAEGESTWTYPEALRFAAHATGTGCDFWNSYVEYPNHEGTNPEVNSATYQLTFALLNTDTDETGIIYDDAIRSGWSPQTDGGVTHDTASATHYSGTYGFGITYQYAWTQQSLVTSGFDTTPYQSLVFDIHGGSTGGQSIYAKFYDENYEVIEAVLITPYVEGGAVVANTWRNVKIPLSVLGATNRVIKGVQFESSSATTITVDNVALSTLGTSEKIYKDSMGTDWQPSTWPTGVESLNLLSTTSGKEGSFAMEVEYEYIWGALYLERLVPLYTGGKRALVFRIKGIANDDVGQIWVMWRDPLEQIGGTVPVADYMVDPPINGWQFDPNAWYTVVIPLDSSALNAENVYIKELIFEVGNLTTIYLDEIYLVDGLEFPLKGTRAYTTKINGVFDHFRHADSVSRNKECPNNTVTAYTGEQGVKGENNTPGTDYSLWSYTSCSSTLYGLPKVGGGAFSIGGQYDQSAESNESGVFLFYDGHAGFDYPETNGTKVHASADGTAYHYTYPGLPEDEYPIRIDHGNGYESYYLHLSTRNVADGTPIRAGQEIGSVGEDHLHYHLRFWGELVDPYGWTDTQNSDPLRPYAVSVPLWK